MGSRAGSLRWSACKNLHLLPKVQAPLLSQLRQGGGLRPSGGGLGGAARCSGGLGLELARSWASCSNAICTVASSSCGSAHSPLRMCEA